MRAADDRTDRERYRGFPKGYETLLGERGITLSGGQKQRTSIARAVMRKPQDPDPGRCPFRSRHVYGRRDPERLRRVMRGRTSIIISHRISTVKDADNIVVLDDGKITEAGDAR